MIGSKLQTFCAIRTIKNEIFLYINELYILQKIKSYFIVAKIENESLSDDVKLVWDIMSLVIEVLFLLALCDY